MPADCIEWSGPMNGDGYGRQGEVFVHRLAYEQAHGAIPLGLEIDHLCRNRLCINPDHLEAVTHAENVRRAAPFRAEALKTHCKSGHEFTPENTYLRPLTVATGGRRQCRTCQRAAVARYKARKAMS